MNVIKHIHNLYTLLDIRKYIVKRNIMNLAYMIMLLFKAQAWGIIREFMEEVAYDLGHLDSCPMLVIVSLLTSFTTF